MTVFVSLGYTYSNHNEPLIRRNNGSFSVVNYYWNFNLGID